MRDTVYFTLPDFLGDTQLLLRPDEPFDPIEGYKAVKERLIENMQ